MLPENTATGVNAPVLSPNLHHQLRLLGFAFLMMAIVTSYLLYSSFGFTDTEKRVYAALGVLLSISTAYLLPTAYTLWINQNPVLSIAAFIIYGSLFFIEFNTSLGFMAVAQEHYKENSGAKLLQKEQLEIAKNSVEKLSNYQSLDLNELNSQHNSVIEKISSLKDKLNNCPTGWITKCEKPKEKAIAKLEIELKTLSNNIKNANQYAQAVTEKKTALNELSSNTSEINSSHPLFKAQAELINDTANNVQVNFLAFSSFIITVLTSVLFLLASVLQKRFMVLPIVSNETKNINEKSVLNKIGDLLKGKLDKALEKKN
jgi:hypothetical protein